MIRQLCFWEKMTVSNFQSYSLSIISHFLTGSNFGSVFKP